RPVSRARFLYFLLVCVACFLLSSCPKSANTQSVPTGRSVHIVEKTGDRAMLLQTQPGVSFTTGGCFRGLVIPVHDATQYQQMDGFGGSLTDSSAWLIWNKLNPAQRNTLMKQLFSPSSGIGISCV